MNFFRYLLRQVLLIQMFLEFYCNMPSAATPVVPADLNDLPVLKQYADFLA